MLKTYITTLLLMLCLSVMAESIESLSIFERYKMSVANRYFEKQNFPKAIVKYEKLYAKNKLTDEYKSEYAIMLLMQGDTEKVVEVLQGTTDSKGRSLLFQAYLYDENYVKADSIFQMYPKITNSSITDKNSLVEYLKTCNPNKNYLINLTEFNSVEMDFSPVVHDEKVYFTSDRGKVAMIRGDYNLTGGGYLDVYEVDGDNIDKVEGDINQPYNDGPVAFSSDGKVVLVTRNNYGVTNYGNQKDTYNALQIFKAQKDDDGEWINFEMLSFCSDEYSCSDPFIYKDELYFTSDMPGGFGENDIYKVSISSNVEVNGKPKNLGIDINTVEQEGFPFLDDSGILYFASKGFVGFGGFDIYRAKNNGMTYEVMNMGSKINSSSDDFSLFMEDKDNGYFASNRPGGVGSDDIYKYHIRPIFNYHVKVIDSNTKKSLSDIAYEISDLPEEGYYDVISDSTELFDFEVFEEIKDAKFNVSETDQYLAFDETLEHEDSLFIIALKSNSIGVYGYVYNKETGERYPSAKMRIYHEDTLWVEFKSDEAGDYMHKLERESDYRIVAMVNGFLPSEAEITTRSRKEWIERNLPVARRIELEGILYDFDKSFITKASSEILDNVVRLMEENPELQIELASHTDCRGSDSYNEKLAEKRSDSAVKYIIERGIDSSRIVAKSHGEYKLKNKCDDGVWCSIEEHHQNRRTEIRILD